MQSPLWKCILCFLGGLLAKHQVRSVPCQSGRTRDELRHYVNHVVLTGFDESLEVIGEGYKWGSHRHQSGHLVNLQEHPAVKRLCDILCQLVNCKSSDIFAILTKVRELDNDNFRPTDPITALLDIVTRAGLPVTALVVNFMGYEFGYTPDLQQLQVSDKDQFVAIGMHLEELKLLYMLEHDIVHGWKFNMPLHAPNLRMLHLKNQGLSGGTALIHCLALVDLTLSLQELQLQCVPALIEDLMVLLQRC